LKHNAFTMVEFIFVIVIIGILASVAIPKLSGVTDGAKKSAEIATISAVATAIETANGEWSINEGDFSWGNHQKSSINPLNIHGYPDNLSANGDVFGAIIKGKNTKFLRVYNDVNISIFTGPASNQQNGVKFTDESSYNNDIPNKPDKNDFWVYAFNAEDCNITCTNCTSKKLYYGDFVLIDVTGKGSTPTSFTCN